MGVPKNSLAIWLLFAASVAVAQDRELQIEERYRPFQGTWRVVSDDQYGCLGRVPPELFVDVTANTFTLRGEGLKSDMPFPLRFYVASHGEAKPYRQLSDRGVEGIEHLVDIDNQIVVSWFVGIYRLNDGVLELRLKYFGQGVEGARFRNFKPPSILEGRVPDDEAHIVLKRVSEAANNASNPSGG